AMTFFGAYRGPAWEAHGAGHEVAHAHDHGGPDDPVKDARLAARHGAPHPGDRHAHGHGHEEDHELAHGPAEPHDPSTGDRGHGPGPWHGPADCPAAMTFPRQALGVGAIVAGFVGIPAALWGNNAIEHFLEPSFTAEHVVATEAAGQTFAPSAE